MTEDEIKARVGDTVYVQLGYITVKCGQIYGYRLTCISDRIDVEYYIHWFGDGDRGKGEEWFPANVIHDTPNKAFNYE